MRPPFVDTWGWCAFADRAESKHSRIVAALGEHWSLGSAVVTTDYVLDETITLLFRRLTFARAQRLLNAIDASIDLGFIDVQRVSAERFAEAKRLRLKYRDKPRISFTDFTSFVVMTELGLADVITDDDHFEHVGMGFRKLG